MAEAVARLMAEDDVHPPTPEAYKAAMRHFIGNVSVITVGLGADRSGLVVTSAISLAAEPPMVIACVNRTASSWPLIQRYRHFGVNFLGGDQQSIAERFSGRGGIKGAERYDGNRWITMATGAPLLADAQVALDCELEDSIDKASHSILIGRIKALSVREGPDALAYWRGAYTVVAE
jgi:flavin reductase (DIM6/NTAB) family NADH-FMN oxidoreductase RutF